VIQKRRHQSLRQNGADTGIAPDHAKTLPTQTHDPNIRCPVLGVNQIPVALEDELMAIFGLSAKGGNGDGKSCSSLS